MKSQKNAIVGFAFNYNNDKISPFLNSLDACGFREDLILYVNNNSRIDTTNYQFKIKLINFEKINHKKVFFFKALRKFNSNKINNYISKIIGKKALDAVEKKYSLPSWISSYYFASYYLATARFILYYSLLTENKYDNVFFTDINDVLFQKDIFAIDIIPGVHCFEENSQVLLGEQYHNSEWIIYGYGMQTYWNMRRNTIYCSGTILGDTESIFLFLKDYINQLVDHDFPRFMIGLDQGIYNFMINHEKLSYFARHPNGNVVFTVGTENIENMTIIDGNITQPFTDDIPTVVHQYNRHEKLVGHVNDRYRQTKI